MNSPYYTQEPGKVTIDDLAAMVGRGFLSMQETLASKEDIAELSGRVDSIEIRLDKLESNVEGISDRLDQLVDLHGKRLSLVESRTNTLRKTVEQGLGTAIAW